MLAAIHPQLVRRALPRATSPRSGSRRRQRELVLYGIATLVFVASGALTVVCSRLMAGNDGMAMPGGWTMSMAWMRMPGQTWVSAAATFVGMWTVMTVAMMLPSLVPALRPHIGRSPWRVAAGYFAVWALFGLAVYPVGVAIAAMTMAWPALSRTIPMVTVSVVLLAGLIQFTPWKARHLACWASVEDASAWRRGARLAFQCGLSCGNWMFVLLALGVMDLRVMAGVTLAITIERSRSQRAST